MKIADGLFLAAAAVPTTGCPSAALSHHILVSDCSGSMSNDLPALRAQLKAELTSLLREGDVLSIVWFSGRGECGVLLEAEPVSTLVDLKRVHEAIDRWLRPLGLTGFKEPLLEVNALLARSAARFPNHTAALFFMSDGHDNQWPREEILAAATALAPAVQSAVFVEFGFYADRPLLTELAKRTGGSLLFSKSFGEYQATFRQAMQARLPGKKIRLPVPNADVIDGLFWALGNDKRLLTFTPTDGAVYVPEGVWYVYYLTLSPPTKPMKLIDASSLYAAASLFATRMRPDIVRPVLRALGDVRLIQAFGNCFGKQAYTSFMEDARNCVFDGTRRFTQGKDTEAQPRPDAFTVLELLKLLSDDEETRLLLDHPSFHYERIGRAKETESTLQFIADPAPNGYSAAALTYNETRPNISLLVCKQGHVVLSPPEFTDMPIGRSVPSEFPTHIWRNYTVIRDGIVNIDQLPVRPSPALRDAVTAAIKSGRLDDSLVQEAGDVWTFRLAEMPIVNEQMVTSVRLKDLLELQYDLTKARAAQKVYNSLRKEARADDDGVADAMERLEGKNEYEMVYGSQAAAWLYAQGFDAKNGFNPLGTLAEPKDFYTGKEMLVKLKGLSSLPPIAQVRSRIAQNKLTASAALMAPALREVDTFLASAAVVKAKKPGVVYAGWLSSQAEGAVRETRSLIRQIAETKFAIILGQVWFTDCRDLDDNVKQIEVDGNTIEGSVELNEIEVPV